MGLDAGRGYTNKVKVGAIGAGNVFIDRFLPKLIEHENFELAAVADVFPAAKKLPSVRSVTGNGDIRYVEVREHQKVPDEFFDDVEAVCITSPNEFHAEQTLESLYHGKFTITEKPIVRNMMELSEFKRMASCAKKDYASRIFCADHYALKPTSAYAAAKLPELIGRYGKIESVKVTFFEGENLRGLPREKWLISPEAGGGVLIDTGSHMAGIVTKVFKGEFVDYGKSLFFDMYPSENFGCETGFYGEFMVGGEYFKQPEKPNVVMKIAKGVGSGNNGSVKSRDYRCKLIEVNLENADLLLNYMKMGNNSCYTGKRAFKSYGAVSGLDAGLHLIRDGVCKNLTAGDEGKALLSHEYVALYDKVYGSLRKGDEPFLRIDDAEKALRPIFTTYDRNGGVYGIKKNLKSTFSEIQDFIHK